MRGVPKFKKDLSIGIIQTNLNFETAWFRGPRMSYATQQKAWLEIQN